MKYMKHLPVPGLTNCRDLGGFACDGGVTRYGIFLRSEAPCNLPEAGVQWLREYGLTASFDLRGEPETAWRPSSLDGPFTYRRLPLSGGAETFEKKNLPEGPFTWDKVYIRRATLYTDWVRDCINACVDNEGCVLFHCTTGKDRTGILACCLLGAVGVSREDIAADYCLSQVYLQDMFAKMRSGELTISAQPAHFTADTFITPFDAMLRFYDFFTEEYGGIRNYLLRIGVTEETLRKLREKFVEAE